MHHGQADGTALPFEDEGGGPLVVLAHGFTQTRASWATVAGRLASDHLVRRVDLPGHGEAGALRSDLADSARRLGAAGGRAVYVGYSMGGRVALRLALDRPDLVTGLVLLGATAGIVDADQRAARHRADGALAERVEAHGVPAFLDHWLSTPLFADLTPDPDDVAARLTNTPAGLASSLRLAGTGTMEPPWWHELAGLTAPTLVLAGERDPKFTELGHRLVTAIGPSASFAPVPLAGHAAHLEQPHTVVDLLRAFVAGLPPA